MPKRDAVDEIIRYNRGFDPASLERKVAAMKNSPFEFFRATHHLFARDVRDDIDRDAPAGLIIADLHAENFGSFRAVSNNIVYDINDFDDCADGPYEYDLRRLLASIAIGGEQFGLSVANCATACSAAIAEYQSAIAAFGAKRKRKDFVSLEPDASIRKLITIAAEQSRSEMIRGLTVQNRATGRYRFRENPSKFAPLLPAQRRDIEQRLFPGFLANCAAPAGADPSRYILEDAVFRFAGKGSLGRERYAILLRKGLADREDVSALRLIEFKESFDSPLTAKAPRKRRQSKGRAREIHAAALRFQLEPKRYWGFSGVFQTREIGANDNRFSPKQYGDAARLASAAKVFGGITARAHLLASLNASGASQDKTAGPRTLATAKLERRLIAFALQYAEQTQQDFEDFVRREPEVRKALGLGPAAPKPNK